MAALEVSVNVPRSPDPFLQHLLDVYASETEKTASVWRAFADDDLRFRPHDRSSTVFEIFRHELLSQRRFFGEFLGVPEPAADAVLPSGASPAMMAARLCDMAQPRLQWLAGRDQRWWRERRPFFDVERERIWIFWRRVLHSAHHRTQLTVYLRLLNKAVPPVYGPTADVTVPGADPTNTVEAASRK